MAEDDYEIPWPAPNTTRFKLFRQADLDAAYVRGFEAGREAAATACEEIADFSVERIDMTRDDAIAAAASLGKENGALRCRNTILSLTPPKGEPR